MVYFGPNNYLEAVKDSGFFEKKFDTSKIQFNYANVNLSNFNIKYSSQGRFVRKIVALPAILWSGIVKTIYHLAKALLIGAVKSCSDKGEYFKVHCFHVARDLQQSFGWMAMLFNDRYGQYHVQEGRFHESCYDYFFEFKHEAKLDKEFDKVNQIGNNKAKDQFYAHLAGEYLTINCIEKAHKAVGKLALNSKVRRDFLVKIASIYLRQNKRDLAIKVIVGLTPNNSTARGQVINPPDYEAKKQFLVKVAELYYSEGNLNKALETIKESPQSEAKNTLLIKLANASFAKGDLDVAFEAIDETPLSEAKNTFLIKLSEAYLAKGAEDQAIKAFSKSDASGVIRDAFFVKAADSYYTKGDLDKSFETILKVVHDGEARSRFGLKIATSYAQKGQFDKLIGMAEKVSFDNDSRKRMYLPIIDCCLETGQHDLAIESFKKLHVDVFEEDAFLVKLANSYFDREVFEKAFETINKVKFSFRQKEALLSKLPLEKVVESYYHQGDLDKAAEILDRSYLLSKKIESSILIKIAYLCLVKNKIDSAYFMINVIDESKDKYLCLIRIAQAYFKSDYPRRAFSIIENLMRFVSNRFAEALYINFNHLANEYLQLTSEVFGNRDNAEIFQEIEKKIIDLMRKTSDAKKDSNYYSKKNTGSQYFKNPIDQDKIDLENAYKTLGLELTASKREIEIKYKKFALQFHPDKVKKLENETDQSCEERKKASEEKFKMYLSAYEKIKEKDDKFK